MIVPSAVEDEILDAVRRLFRILRQDRPILSRATINRELMENSRDYPTIQTYNLPIRRKQITLVCNSHFEPCSLNWRSGAWLVTAERLA